MYSDNGRLGAAQLAQLFVDYELGRFIYIRKESLSGVISTKVQQGQQLILELYDKFRGFWNTAVKKGVFDVGDHNKSFENK